MSLSRRDFLKIMGGTTAAVAFPGVLIQGCKKAIQKASKRTNVIWIQAQSCSGCSVSLLNKVNPDIATVITEYISLNYHQTLMAGTGHVAIDVLEDAVKNKRKDFVLIVEGSIPTGAHEYCTIGVDSKTGKHVSALEWITELGKNAIAVVSVGSCAAFGGIPGAKDQTTGKNPTNAVPVSEIIKDKPVINIPGCPSHPDWIVGSLLHVLLKGMPKLDEYNRPLLYFGKTVHDQCEHLHDYKKGVFAKHWGDKGCLYQLGCLGMDSDCDIPTRKWVDGTNTCTGSGAGCIGCVEKAFPDFGNRGLFQHMTASADELKDAGLPNTAQAMLKMKNGGTING